VTNNEAKFPTAFKIPFIFLFWELRGLGPNFHIHVSVSDFYIPRIIFSCSRIGRLIMEICKPLTDTYMNVGTGRQNILILFWKEQFHFWEYVNGNQLPDIYIGF
jgi:hypothetical protein